VAKVAVKKDSRRRTHKDDQLPLGRENFLIIGAGLLTIIAGYGALSAGGVEGFLPLVVAPILLVLGYCVVIPFGIMYRKEWFRKREGTSEDGRPAGA
jgi:hypothetical protein